MRYGDPIQLDQSFGLWYFLAQENGVEAFQIAEDHQLLQRGSVPDVSFGLGIFRAPFFCCFSEKGDIEEVRLAGINDCGLRRRDLHGEQGFLDGVGVNAIVDLGQCALKVPFQPEPVVFRILEALEFRDEVELEFRAEPRAELEGDVFVGIGAALATRAGNQPSGTGQLDPFFGR